MGKLSNTQIAEYFDKHLPYRNRILLAHKNLCSKGPYEGDKDRFRSNDISAEDLGGRLVDVQKIPVSDKTLFEGFLQMANKNVHLTKPMNHPWDRTHDAIELIVRYMKEYLYLPTKRDFTLQDC